MFTAASPRTSVTMMNSSTANVVILMPPPVPAGPAPMNMKTSWANQVCVCISAVSSELNPAERVKLEELVRELDG